MVILFLVVICRTAIVELIKCVEITCTPIAVNVVSTLFLLWRKGASVLRGCLWVTPGHSWSVQPGWGLRTLDHLGPAVPGSVRGLWCYPLCIQGLGVCFLSALPGPLLSVMVKMYMSPVTGSVEHFPEFHAVTSARCKWLLV